MKVLVDTCIWSDAFRKSSYDKNSAYVKELFELIREGRIQMIGPIRQEILSGIRYKTQFENLKNKLERFSDLEIGTEDYEMAAWNFNQCRKNGIQGSNIDFLICAISKNHQLPVFTRDKDFELFQSIIQIKLHKSRF